MPTRRPMTGLSESSMISLMRSAAASDSDMILKAMGGSPLSVHCDI